LQGLPTLEAGTSLRRRPCATQDRAKLCTTQLGKGANGMCKEKHVHVQKNRRRSYAEYVGLCAGPCAVPLLDAGALCHTRACTSSSSGGSSSSSRCSGPSNHRSNHKDNSVHQSFQNEAFVPDPSFAATAAHCRGDQASQICSRVERSSEHLAKIRQRGMVPSLDECNAVMRACLKRGKAANVMQMLSDMLRDGPEPDLVSFHITLDACERRRLADWAVYALSQAVRQGMRPAVDAYNKAMCACRGQKQWGTAQWLVAQMRKQGVQPNGISFRIVMDTALMDNQAVIVCGTINEMQDAGMTLQPDAHVSGIKAWAADTCWSRALQLMSKCRSSGLQPMDYASYRGGLACARSSQWERAQHLFDASAQQGLDRHLQALEVMAIASRMAGLWERAASQLQELRHSAVRSQ